MATIVRKALFVQIPEKEHKKVTDECKRLEIPQWQFIAHAIRHAPKLTRGKGDAAHVIVSGLEPRNRKSIGRG